MADGVLLAGGDAIANLSWQTMLTSGTVLVVWENADSERSFITPEVITMMGCALHPVELRKRLTAWESAGTAEVAYQPAGPDIELDAYMTAARV